MCIKSTGNLVSTACNQTRPALSANQPPHRLKADRQCRSQPPSSSGAQSSAVVHTVNNTPVDRVQQDRPNARVCCLGQRARLVRKASLQQPPAAAAGAVFAAAWRWGWGCCCDRSRRMLVDLRQLVQRYVANLHVAICGRCWQLKQAGSEVEGQRMLGAAAACWCGGCRRVGLRARGAVGGAICCCCIGGSGQWVDAHRRVSRAGRRGGTGFVRSGRSFSQ